MPRFVRSLLPWGAAALAASCLLGCVDPGPSPPDPDAGLIRYTEESAARGLLMPESVRRTPGQISAVDVNGDGFADLVMLPSAETAAAPILLLNDGMGNFAAEQPLPGVSLGGTESRLAGTVWADFDGDGHADLLAVGRFDEADTTRSSRALWLRKSGSPSEFVSATQLAGLECQGASCESEAHDGACVADVDGDGDFDIFLVGTLHDSLFYLNEGDGTFVPKTVSSMRSSACVFVDYDEDGDVDLFLMGDGSQNHELLLNDGSGNFEVKDVTGPPNPFMHDSCSTGGLPGYSRDRGLQLADFNGDGHVDILAWCGQDSAFGQLVGYVNLLFGDGQGGTTKGFDIFFPVPGPQIGDFDADGDVDIVAPEQNAFSTTHTRWYQNRGTKRVGNFSFLSFVDVSDTVNFAVENRICYQEAVSGDFDSDGLLEVVLVDGCGIGQGKLALFAARAFAPDQNPNQRYLRVRPVTEAGSLFLGADVRVFEAGTQTEAAARAVISGSSGAQNGYDTYFGLTTSSALKFDVEVRCGSSSITKMEKVDPNQVIAVQCGPAARSSLSV